MIALMTRGQLVAARTVAILADSFTLDSIRDENRARLDEVLRGPDASEDAAHVLGAALWAFSAWLPADDPVVAGATWTLNGLNFECTDDVVMTRPSPLTPARQVQGLLRASLVSPEDSAAALLKVGPTVRGKHAKTALALQAFRLRLYGYDIRPDIAGLLTSAIASDPIRLRLFVAGRGRASSGLYNAMAPARRRVEHNLDDPPF